MIKKFIVKTLLIPTLTVLSLASCGANENKLTVKWTNYNGSELLVEKYSKGDTPSYKGDTPKKPSEGTTDYTFSGWSPDIGPITQDTTYVAQYKAIIKETYTVTWKNYNGDILFTENNVPHGTNPKYPGTELPTRPMTSGTYYVFKGWTPEFSPVVANVEYTADYYAVTSTSDYDYDGMPDCIDPNPTNNVFSNVLLKCVYQRTGEVTIDYRMLTNGDNNTYNKDLAKLGVYLSNRSVDFQDGMFTPEEFGGDIKALYTRLGCDDIYDINMKSEDYQIDTNDIDGASLAHHVVEEGSKKTDVIFLSVQSTRGSTNICEWVSNFDVGSTAGVYEKVTGTHPEWVDKSYHKGFSVATERFLSNNKTMGAKKYVDEHCSNGAPVLFICGHSRGGASANILGEYFTNKYKTPAGDKCKVFTYTYASPGTRDTKDAPSVSTTFNIVNSDDIVTMLPLKQWGMDRLGPSGKIDYIDDSVKDLYSEQYKTTTGRDYDNLVGIKEILSPIKATRDDLYNPAKTKENEAVVYKGYISKEKALAKQAEIIDGIKNDIKISPDYFTFDIVEIPGTTVKYELHVYNCLGTIFAIIDNVLMNVYPDLSVLYPYISLVSNQRYIDLLNNLLDAGVTNFDKVAMPHDLSAYITIIENHQ